MQGLHPNSFQEGAYPYGEIWSCVTVYEVLCSCGKVYIGETIDRITKRALETRMKEHRAVA